ncbi:unnamed protein product [Allacma fusca]|uniref:Uncharacterized protein n=1 Tax=Allacma fusca TaxID=39272 RepID=A0A8J2KN92_9HEXA|nr:unnamed protein product [Allacma fusca]
MECSLCQVSAFIKKMSAAEYTINQTWNGLKPEDSAEIKISFSSTTIRGITNEEGLIINVNAPFYNDPRVPEDTPKGSMAKLWDYEVVEVFFLADDNKYLEIELAPKGQYLILKLDGCRNIVEEQLPLKTYLSSVEGDRWMGEAIIPFSYFPANVSRFNAYAIHRSDPNRVYMALFPTPPNLHSQPDFHRLDYFRSVDLFKELLP